MKKLYTQLEDGSFHPLTTTNMETLQTLIEVGAIVFLAFVAFAIWE